MAPNSSLAVLFLLLTLSCGALAVVRLRQAPGLDSISYRQFLVDSRIVARYASTTVTSVVRNEAAVAQELAFQVQLPATAFISQFNM